MNPVSADFPGAGKLAKTSPRRPQGGKFGNQKMWGMKLQLKFDCDMPLPCPLLVSCKGRRTNCFVSEFLMRVAFVAQSGHAWISLCGMRVLG